jgi:Leucine-rich repeat (LRR) protein
LVHRLQSLGLLNLARNNFAGEISHSLEELNWLDYLDLSNNHLTGEIPDSLMGLNNLVYLDLSNNHLTGEIPDRAMGLVRLNYLDLSNNQLSGPFPESFHRLRSLGLLNLGGNDISGEIPLVIGEGRNNRGPALTNIREFIRLLSTLDDPLLPYRERIEHSRRIFKNPFPAIGEIMRELMYNPSIYKDKFETLRGFLKKNSDLSKISKDLLWVDPSNHNWNSLNFGKVLDEYISAEQKLFLTTIFQNIQKMDPVHLIQNTQQSLEGTNILPNQRIRIA